MDKPKKSAKKPTTPKMLTAHITYLEMTSPLVKIPPVPTKPSIALITANNIPAKFYSYIYELVGKPYHWEERRKMPPSEISGIINSEDCAISILYVEGCPAGFFELNLEDVPNSIELKYAGLAQEYQSLGLGKWFLAAAISAAWARKPECLKLETNTLDHPAALPLYQKLGFSPIGISQAQVEPWC